jgi:hypothetical protein
VWNFFNKYLKKFKKEELPFSELTQNKKCFGTWNCLMQEERSCIDKISCHSLFRRNLNLFSTEQQCTEQEFKKET